MVIPRTPISWAEYFMGIAILSAQRSKDPSTQVGACLVSPENKIVGIGYNGFPNGCLDSQLPWGRDSDNPLETKYLYVVHAEKNAILNSTRKLKRCTLYVTLFPCHECAKDIIQSGIKRIIYLREPKDPKHSNSLKAAKRMFDLVEVKYSQFLSNSDYLTLNFS